MGLFNDFDRAEAEMLRKENKELKEQIRILEERINKQQNSGIHLKSNVSDYYNINKTIYNKVYL
jgi:hypothetical protein